MATNSALVKFQLINTSDSDLNLVQQNLVRTLNPIYNTQTLGGTILQNIPLKAGANSINHKLGRNLVGWQLTRIRAASTIFDTQDTNKTPDLTLNLNSSADVIVDLYVF